MGTNFYLNTDNKKLVNRHFNRDEFNVVDEPFFGYEIHLCKRSCGWRPLFEIHTAFSSFRELEKFYLENSSEYRIFDEYGHEYTFEDFKKEMIAHSEREPEPVKWVYQQNLLTNPDGRKTLDTVNCKPEEADLYVPFSHEEYGKTLLEAKRKYQCTDGMDYYLVNYIKDPTYKFDWVKGEFS